MLRPTVSRPVCVGVRHLSGTQDQIFVTVRQLRVCGFVAPSLTIVAAELKVKVEVTLRQSVYRQSVRLGVKPLENHDQSFFLQLNPFCHGPCVVSL
jgi:hypothetical protein